MTVPGGRKVDATGRSTGRLKTNSRQKIEGPFVMHRRDMLSSPAWRALGGPERRILDRLEIEHMNHGGGENGHLIVTYDDFERYGIRRKSIARGLLDLSVLGFVEVTQRGRMAAAEFHVPSKYRLTYLYTFGPADGPTDEWAKIATDEEAAALLQGLPTKTRPAAGSTTMPPGSASARVGLRSDNVRAFALVIPSQDIDRGGENAPGPVGAKTPPELARCRGENAPGTRGENAPGKMISGSRAL